MRKWKLIADGRIMTRGFACEATAACYNNADLK